MICPLEVYTYIYMLQALPLLGTVRFIPLFCSSYPGCFEYTIFLALVWVGWSFGVLIPLLYANMYIVSQQSLHFLVKNQI